MLVLVAIALLVAPASAQGVLVAADGGLDCIVPDDGATFEGATCSATLCAAPGTVCAPVTGGARCFDPGRELLCVAGGCDGCPMVSTGADPERCVTVTDAGGGPHAVCIYSPPLACIGDLDPADRDLAACLIDTDLARGDCDGDARANAIDACPCEAAPTIDGCPRTPDGGNVVDAAIAPDAAQSIDAASIDATAPLDARPPPPGVSFRGGGGCLCALSSADPPWSPIALLALAIVARRRR